MVILLKVLVIGVVLGVILEMFIMALSLFENQPCPYCGEYIAEATSGLAQEMEAISYL